MVGVPLGDVREHVAHEREDGAALVVEPLLARPDVVDGAVVDRADQRPEVGQRLDLLARREDRAAQLAVAVQVVLDPLREVRDRQLADVAAVHPAQLLLVEARRVLLHALELEAPDELGGRDDRLVVDIAPPEQREVVAHRLGEVAGVAQLLDRRGTVALGELLAVGAVQKREVRVDRLLGAERLQDQQLLGRVGVVVVAADDVGDGGVEVVDGDREVVERRAVGTGDDGVVHVDVLEGRLAADEVADDRGAVVWHAQAHGAGVLGLAAEAAVGAVAVLVAANVLRGRVGAVRVPAVQQLLDDLAVAIDALGLEDRALVVVELEPAQRVEDLLDVLGRRALAVGVLDAQDERAAGVARGEPVVERRPRAADVQRAGRRGGEADPHEPSAWYGLRSRAPC